MSVLVSNATPPNQRLKLAARVDWGMNLSSARRSLSAIRLAAASTFLSNLSDSMDTIWQTFLFRLAEHAHVLIPVLIATGVLGLGPIGRAIARRLGGTDTERQELERLREQVAELQE